MECSSNHRGGAHIVGGTLLNSFTGQICEDRGFLVADPVYFIRRYLNLSAGKPMTGFDDQLANGPSLIVHHKIADMADSSVASLEVVAVDGLGAPEMRARASGWRVTGGGRRDGQR